MSSLTENTIKQLALGYLKSFYRLRARASNTATLTGTDLRGANNVIADGFLHYTDDKGKIYRATIEATSHTTREEILYRPRLGHVFWDAAAFAFLLLPTLLAIAHIFNWYPIATAFNRNLGFLILSIPAWMGLYYLFFKRLPRYRYIYAIEQFKQYQADDQWVAFGYDTFSGLKKKYRHELIRQCTRYGFGLLEITAQRSPKLIMAPSRAENFVPKTQVFQFLPFAEWQERIRSIAKGPWERFKKRFRERFLSEQNRYFRWFPRTYYNQWLLLGIGIFATVLMLTREYQEIPVLYPNENRYRKQVLEAHEGQRPETEYFVIDAPIAGFYDSTFSPYEIRSNEEQFSNLIQPDDAQEEEVTTAPPIRIVAAIPGEEVSLYYSCDRYNGLYNTFYLLADSVYAQLSSARQRMAELNENGITATAVWPPCLGGTGRGFLVYLDEVMTDSTNAELLRDSLQTQLDSTARPLRVVKFYPITNQVE